LLSVLLQSFAHVFVSGCKVAHKATMGNQLNSLIAKHHPWTGTAEASWANNAIGLASNAHTTIVVVVPTGLTVAIAI